MKTGHPFSNSNRNPAVGYFIVESGFVLASTLPPETFDFDLAMDDRRGARRAMTIVVLLLNGMQG